MTGNRFEGQALACVRAGRQVFAGLDFVLEAGGVLVLTGRNGSGKTSLLRLAAGLAQPARGLLAWQDGPVAEDPARHHARLHYVGHLDAIKPALSVHENLLLWVRLRGGDPGRAGAALDRFGLDDLASLPARYLSAGQRRRLALCRLFSADVPLWLLDEPTVALDRPSVTALDEALARHRNAGGMAIIATNVDLAVPGARVLSLDDHAVPADAFAFAS